MPGPDALFGRLTPPTLVPAHGVAGPESPMWRKTPVATVGFSLPVPAAKSPACTVEGSPGRAAGPTSVQCGPSAESYPVTVLPARTSRSQRGADADTLPARPGVSST